MSPVSAKVEPGRSGSLFLGTSLYHVPDGTDHPYILLLPLAGCAVVVELSFELGFLLLFPLTCIKIFSKTLRVLFACAGGVKVLVPSGRLHVWGSKSKRASCSLSEILQTNQ